MSIEALEQGLLNDQNNSEEAAVRDILTYFSKGGTVNQKTADGRTPLMLAIKYSFNTSIDGYNIEVIKYVLNKRPDILAKDNDNESALFYAVTWSCSEVVDILIKSGCDPNERGSNDITPLMKAMQINANIKIIDVLLANNADLYAANKSGSTAFHEAAGMGRLEILQHLKPKMRDFELRNKIEVFALKKASVNDDLRVLKFLLDNGAKVDVSDNEKKTPLMWAVHADQLKNAEFLLKRGANVSLKNNESKTALDMAMEKNENERNDFMRILKPLSLKTSLSSDFDKTFKQSINSQSTSFQLTQYSKRPSSSIPFHQEPHLRITQDLKYVGQQFIVGKTNPKLQSTHELRFQRLFGARLKKLHIDKSKEQRPLTITELKELHSSLAVNKKYKF